MRNYVKRRCITLVLKSSFWMKWLSQGTGRKYYFNLSQVKMSGTFYSFVIRTDKMGICMFSRSSWFLYLHSVRCRKTDFSTSSEWKSDFSHHLFLICTDVADWPPPGTAHSKLQVLCVISGRSSHITSVFTWEYEDPCTNYLPGR